MPFDPNFPPDQQPLNAAPFRDQYNALNDLITDLPTMANVNDAIVSNTPRNCDNVAAFTGTFSNPPTAAELVAFKNWANGLLAQLHRV